MTLAAEELRHLEEAKGLIERGEALATQQKRSLDQLRRDGHPTEEAAKTWQVSKALCMLLATREA